MEGSTDDESDGSGSGTSTSVNNYEQEPNQFETKGASSSNSSSSSSSTPLYCTFAITGADRAFHQPIFVCRTCCGLNDEPPNPDSDEPQPEPQPSPQALRCICESCAEACHEALGHDVEYMGIGPCTCDCGVDVPSNDGLARNVDGCACLLRDCSTKKKEELGIQAPRPPCTTDDDLLGCCVYQLREPRAPNDAPPANDLFARLVEEGKALIEHSKETFWISPHDTTNDNDNGSHLCALEQMALAIYRLHTEHQPESLGGGAEWWIQFTPNDEQGGIDLHYDKDETLAEHFRLGSFPAVSTVTYLTDVATDADVYGNAEHSYQTPTRIFQHAYHDDEGTPISQMIESYPVIGKHLAFDGRYLHGAPRIDSVRSTRNRDDGTNSRGERMTFLVNIWPEGCKPCGSNMLPPHLRDTILSNSSALGDELIPNLMEFGTKQDICKRTIRTPDLCAVDRISVPFVSTGATWIDPINPDDDDDEEGLVLTMYPTPPLENADHTHTTVCYQWEEGLEARLEHVYHDYDYDNENEAETSVGSLEDATNHSDRADISSTDCYRKQNRSILNHMQQNGGIKCVAYV